MNIELLSGWLLDLLLGDPPRLPHPVVGMGRWIGFWEHRLNRGSHRRLKGALLVSITLALVFALGWLLRCVEPSWLRGALTAVLIFFCLAGRTLRREVRLVFEALERSLDDGRRQVGRIVGRDTASLSAQEVRTAALETLAENLSDGVVAPLFWYALLGLPGMLTYKAVNTFDSMIGYRTERYRQFGCWAARIDDVANYVPARLTALLILVAAWLVQPGRRSPRRLAAFVWRYGPCHASPNSGWPEAALAAVLDCQFGGAHDYFGERVEKPLIGTNPRPLGLSDLRLSLRVALLAELICVATIVIIS